MEEEEEDEYIPCKIVLLGEAGVGKTSIITRYISGSFSQVVMTSTGSSFVAKKIELDDKKKIKLQIWDTAGQERYRSLAKIFYQSAAVAVLVYDVTLKKSFEQLKEYWVKEIKDNAPDNIIIAIAANKSDDYLNQDVDTADGKKLAKSLDALFICTSAKLGNGIEELFKLSGEKFLNPNKNISDSYMNKDEILEQKNRIKIEQIREKKNEKNQKKSCC
jgi:small GTP-binding protein